MSPILIQKLLISIVILTTFFLAYIFTLHYDLTRKISRSIFEIIPALLMFTVGIIISRVLSNPETMFKNFLHVKSGTIKGILGATHLPLVATTIRTMSLIACLTALIDKFWFYWQNKRLSFIFRFIISICMTIIAGNTLFKIIFANQKQLINQIEINKKIGFWAGTGLGIILILIIVLAIPTLFANKKSDDSNDT